MRSTAMTLGCNQAEGSSSRLNSSGASLLLLLHSLGMSEVAFDGTAMGKAPMEGFVWYCSSAAVSVQYPAIVH